MYVDMHVYIHIYIYIYIYLVSQCGCPLLLWHMDMLCRCFTRVDMLENSDDDNDDDDDYYYYY